MTSSTLPDDGERTRLTRAAVVDRALALADKSGLDALTIRKLATELGVTPMALYWHFRGKDELLDGLAERLWSEIDLTVDRAAPWTEQIRALLESLLTVLRAHPAAPELLLHSEKLNSEPALNATELTLDILRTAGFSPEDASIAARSTLWTGITLVMSEPGIESLDDAERTEVAAQEAGHAGDAVVGQVPAAGRVRAPDDGVRQPGGSLQVRRGPVRRRPRGDRRHARPRRASG